ncbi:MAG: hypothetical protein BGO99_05920 [Nitrosospira sp. 56-18]|nr:MAG: hypothetical protein BGO99_05920 [Nitrosospira sp. 56-18]
MIQKDFPRFSTFIYMVSLLQGGLRGFWSTWLRCNSLEWNGHSASSRFALHPGNRTFHPVQLPDSG